MQTANNESDSTIRTTATERRRAKLISRFFVNIMKCFRLCKKKKKNENDV